ncbi:hypothetical protein ADK70_38480 [Streptomyces rimosus subsp. pseudoverticillatus]|uniref:putative ATP-grasp-modified RiPP n=1 Tax=Streptomyces rimosus TaxID=1927 RepID=UPI0006B28511|nr:putative ATP-grasp-modified RiPP [Streptomyces rimosus]KOT76371.1 hypothetical protein ADK70_38480 [Streptomyces rimosus subsp. pseudoverticillatus]
MPTALPAPAVRPYVLQLMTPLRADTDASAAEPHHYNPARQLVVDAAGAPVQCDPPTSVMDVCHRGTKERIDRMGGNTGGMDSWW